ncbi:hypothetical protein [Pedobacter psychroterrae]|uniref:Uncharacterized protein n=1 Tax=Pedobacter psychroterrae TaxID=2530453 RepID=A0A4R0NIM3_9SPHI|nr:hypothetical protein [Pedobacter psychroterrae]TCD00530.1 hypothetical protein EZ437_15030 [Pedobacter psychroterrae]
MKGFDPVNSLSQLIRSILIWVTIEVLFLRFVLNAPWPMIALFVGVFILVQVLRYPKQKTTRAAN